VTRTIEHADVLDDELVVGHLELQRRALGDNKTDVILGEFWVLFRVKYGRVLRQKRHSLVVNATKLGPRYQGATILDEQPRAWSCWNIEPHPDQSSPKPGQ
jgi:hypothetical protein